MGRTGAGIEVRDTSIRLSFVWQGKPCKETLRTDGRPMAPTPANLKYAHRLAAEIREKIRHGAFVYADYFPASRNATTGLGPSVGDQLDLWLGLQTGLAGSTLKGYRIAVDWWKEKIGAKQLRALVHSDILGALASEPTWTGKTRNNKVSPLRQALVLALRDGALRSNPLDGLEAAKHQKPPPDPFSRDEAEAILADMHERQDPRVALYFQLKFFTGMRTSESLALRWESIDWRRQQMVVREGIGWTAPGRRGWRRAASLRPALKRRVLRQHHAHLLQRLLELGGLDGLHWRRCALQQAADPGQHRDLGHDALAEGYGLDHGSLTTVRMAGTSGRSTVWPASSCVQSLRNTICPGWAPLQPTKVWQRLPHFGWFIIHSCPSMPASSNLCRISACSGLLSGSYGCG